MHPARAERLAKLIWALHQENDFELANAARAISRLLKAENVDLPALTRLLSGLAPGAAAPGGTRSEAIRNDLDTIRRCRFSRVLTAWEGIQLDKLEEQLTLGVELTKGQRTNLQTIFSRVVPERAGGWSSP